MSCQKPNCTRDDSETYNDEHGNELELCNKHYYELVSGKSVKEDTSNPLGIGSDIPPIEYDSFDPGIRTRKDITDFELDRPKGTTSCPDCGKPMGLVTWTGEKPSCYRCNETPNDKFGPVWHGVIDPHTGEGLGPTMDSGPLASEKLDGIRYEG